MTPTLSRLAPISRLTSLRRLPFWAQALALCALFAIAGVAVLDDYGMVGDEIYHRQTANANADYIATGDMSKLARPSDPAHRYYGKSLDMSLLLLERALGLQDTRHILLTRHLITHLFFIAGGFACGMLAYRMLGSRWAALLAMLMFLLHPRLYAHSFFNVKDVPFAALLLVALYLTHRAFRRDTLGAFLLCGIVAGLAINLRVFGLMLLPMILAMRALDLCQAGREERMRILATAGIFAAAALATVYIIHPYYWENPLRFIEGIVALSQHPLIHGNLFMGEFYLSDAVPWNYIPVWFAITAPPVALALGALGAAAVCWQAITRPNAALRAREIRFRVMLLGCIALPVATAIILQSNIYNGWRQMYFLWAPFCLLAAVGLHYIANISMGEGIWKVGARLPGWIRGGGYRLHMARWALAYGIAGGGLLTTLTAMASLHPHQQVYFNALVDTKTPGALAKRYDMDYWQVADKQSLERLLARYPDDVLRVWTSMKTLRILPQSDRDRIVITRSPDADFYIIPRGYYHYRRDTPEPPRFHSIKAYGSGINFILAPNSDAYLDHYRAEYTDVKTNGTLLSRSAFDIYAHKGALHYIRANCAPLMAADADSAGIFLHIFPADPADLPAVWREYGFENRDFWIAGRAALFRHTGFIDGKCVAQRPLPDYAIERIHTGEYAEGEIIWRADINLVARDAMQAVYDAIAAGDYGAPVAQSDFDVYMRGNRMAYLKEPCAPDNADARFFLHIFPADPADLPAVWRELGFANLDFHFADHGAHAGDICVASLDLPDYPIAHIRTGQFVSGEGDLWRVEFPAAQ